MSRLARWRVAATAAALVVGLAGCSKSAPAPAGDHSHDPTPTSSTPVTAALAKQLSDARAATARYANDLDAAKDDGYEIITQMMPGMGYPYMNRQIKGFDVTKPAILVYLKNGSAWQLAALEWVFPSTPAEPPLDGATYGSFAAACHYNDGTFVPSDDQGKCASVGPSGSRFNFWHPDLTTLHVWLWYDNPAGLYNGTNPRVPAAA